MNSPIEASFQSGATVYAVIHSPSGQVWNQFLSAYENYNAAHWAQYAVALTEQAGSGYYSAAFPSGAALALTTEVIYQQKGGSPALSDGPPIGIGQSQGTDIRQVSGDPTAAGNLQSSLSAMRQGSVITGTISSTQVSTNLPDTTNDVYVGRVILFTSGAAIRQAANILAYDGTTRILIFSPLTTAPSAGDTFVIV